MSRCRAQSAVIGAVNDAARRDRGGGLRGRARCRATCTSSGARAIPGKGYHVEYGYSCMGYEIPGGMGVKLAAPEREVFVMVGDGSYLMLPGRARDGGRRADPDRVVLVDNHGYASIGALSRSVGSAGFGTHYAARERRAGRRARRRRPPARAAAGRPRRERREPRRAGDPRARRSTSCARRSPPRGAPTARSSIHDRGRPLRGRARLRELVGRAGRRGLRGRPSGGTGGLRAGARAST